MNGNSIGHDMSGLYTRAQICTVTTGPETVYDVLSRPTAASVGIEKR